MVVSVVKKKKKKRMVEADSYIDNREPKNRSRKPKQNSEGATRRWKYLVNSGTNSFKEGRM